MPRRANRNGVNKSALVREQLTMDPKIKVREIVEALGQKGNNRPQHLPGCGPSHPPFQFDLPAGRLRKRLCRHSPRSHRRDRARPRDPTPDRFPSRVSRPAKSQRKAFPGSGDHRRHNQRETSRPGPSLAAVVEKWSEADPAASAENSKAGAFLDQRHANHPRRVRPGPTRSSFLRLRHRGFALRLPSLLQNR